MIKDYLLIICILFITTLLIIQIIKIENLKKYLYYIQKLKKDIYNLCESVSKVEDKNQVYPLILDNTIKLINKSDRGSILLLDEDDNFYFKAIRGYNDKIFEVKFKREEVYLYRCNNFKDTAIIKDPNSLSRSYASMDNINLLDEIGALKIYSTLCSPLYIEDKLIGIMNIDISDKDKSFDEEDMTIINYAKYELELALKNFLAKDKLKYLASHDELTNLYNRRTAKELIAKEIIHVKNKNHNSCVALMDLDNFKLINDTYGHNMGDKALISFAQNILNHIEDEDFAIRMSGDEFVIIFINKDKIAAEKILEKIKNSLSNCNLMPFKLSFSYGICSIDTDTFNTVDDILSIADKKMYEEKKLKK